MLEPLTDAQLDELERLADEDRRMGVFTHPGYARAAREAVPALIAEVRALRRVAAEAEASIMSAKACCGRWGGERDCTPWTSRGQTCIDCPYENVADTEAALAEWRRVRGLPEREGSG